MTSVPTFLFYPSSDIVGPHPLLVEPSQVALQILSQCAFFFEPFRFFRKYSPSFSRLRPPRQIRPPTLRLIFLESFFGVSKFFLVRVCYGLISIQPPTAVISLGYNSCPSAFPHAPPADDNKSQSPSQSGLCVTSVASTSSFLRVGSSFWS